MRSMSCVREGFCLAGRHKWLAVVLWLVPLIAALLLGAMAYANIAPVFDRSFYADRVLDDIKARVTIRLRRVPWDQALDLILRNNDLGWTMVGDTIHVRGHTSDFSQKVESMQIEHEPISEAGKGQEIAMKVERRVRNHDKVYKLSGDDI